MRTPPLAALFRDDAAGLPPPEPLDFGTLVLPPSPNTCLAAPSGAHPGAHITVPPLPVEAATAWPVLRAVGERVPRTPLLAEWPERRRAQWVQRSALVRFPDIVVAELRPGPAAASTHLFLYSRSLFGWSDFGVNRRRVQAWLAALDAALARRG